MGTLKDITEKSIYGMTATEARDKGICIHCKTKINGEKNHPGGIWTQDGHREYSITAICETCFNDIVSRLE